MSLTPAGYDAPRLIDLIEQARQSLSVSLPDLATDDDTVAGNLIAAILERAAELSEATQALYDAFNPDTATGASLDSIAAIVGTERLAATPAIVNVEMTGTPATTVPAGTLFADATGTQFALQAAALIGGGGTVEGSAAAVTPGRIEVVAGDIDQIVTPVAGLSDVLGLSVLSFGTDEETDAQLRARRLQRAQGVGRGTEAALRSRLLAIDGIVSVGVTSNRTPDPPDPHSFRCTLFPQTSDPDILDAIARTIWETQPAGIASAGSESAVVFLQDAPDVGNEVRWDWVQVVLYGVEVLRSVNGLYPPNGDALIRDAVAAYFTGIDPGGAARRLDLLCAVRQVPGVVAAEIRFSAGAAWNPATVLPGDVEPDPGVLPSLDTSDLLAAVDVGGL